MSHKSPSFKLLQSIVGYAFYSQEDNHAYNVHDRPGAVLAQPKPSK
jgi:hypothetical protein